MLFPQSERVVYQKSPVHEVICQVRFPSILKIDTEMPADFQDRIRDIYPEFQSRRDQSVIQLELQGRDLIPQELKEILPKNTSYDFVSSDGQWTVSLTRDFLALSTSGYNRWEKFAEQLEQALEALIAVYRPNYFTRIGLRYTNLVSLVELGLEGVHWAELIHPRLAGVLADEQIGQLVQSNLQNFLLELPSLDSQIEVNAKVQSGIVTANLGGVQEQRYLLDNDFFVDKRTEIGNELGILAEFNRNARDLFRWSITDRLHDAFDPEPIGDSD